MRRFAAADGTQFDELPCGHLRRRLRRGDPRPIPTPQTLAEIKAVFGELREMTQNELTIERGFARR
jgi:hypothetical protein